jgi:hypothetical protein
MTQDDIIRMAQEAGWNKGESMSDCYACGVFDFDEFVKSVADRHQQDVDALYALYQQASQQRDALMDQQRSMIAAMRGKLQ